MSPAERQAAIDAAAKLGHKFTREGKAYRCACGHLIACSDQELIRQCLDLHARNAVALGRKVQSNE